MRVGVDQQGQQHLRRERRLARMAQLVAGLEPAQVHHRHRVDDQVNDVVFRQPVHHVGWEQKGLTSFRCAKVVRHRSIRVVAVSWESDDRIARRPARQHRSAPKHAVTTFPKAIVQQAL